MPFTHPDYPLNSEFGKISSLEESHENPAEDGSRTPGIGRHNLFGNQESCFHGLILNKFLNEEDEMSGKTYQFDFLYVRIPPFEDNKKQLIGFL